MLLQRHGPVQTLSPATPNVGSHKYVSWTFFKHVQLLCHTLLTLLSHDWTHRCDSFRDNSLAARLQRCLVTHLPNVNVCYVTALRCKDDSCSGRSTRGCRKYGTFVIYTMWQPVLLITKTVWPTLTKDEAVLLSELWLTQFGWGRSFTFRRKWHSTVIQLLVGKVLELWQAMSHELKWPLNGHHQAEHYMMST